jgi:molecular chaperone GrpE
MAFGWKKRMEAKNETDSADRPAEAQDAAPVDAELLESPPDDETALLIAQLEAERDEALAHAQRATADYQNLRRRTQADLEASAKRARGEVLAEALTVLDYLDMALATECATEEGKNLKVGVAMTRTQLAALLERYKVKEIPSSKVFDATYHQAFATVETTEHPPGSIVEVFRKGWLYGDQVLRHAQVRVAAAPKVVEPPAAGTDPGVDEVSDESHDRMSD